MAFQLTPPPTTISEYVWQQHLYNFVKDLTTSSGTVTSVDGSGGTTGLTLTGGPITASGTLTLGGTLVVANGGTGAGAFTKGSVVFAGTSGVYTQDNASFFWDDTNNRLGVGSASPGVAINAYYTGVTGSGEIRSTDNTSGTVDTFIQSSAPTGGFIGTRTAHPLFFKTGDTSGFGISYVEVGGVAKPGHLNWGFTVGSTGPSWVTGSVIHGDVSNFAVAIAGTGPTNSPLFAGIQTSDATSGGYFAAEFVALANKTSGSIGTWAQYIEAYAMPTASISSLMGVEMGVFNLNSTPVTSTPFDTDGAGVINGIRIGSGKPDTITAGAFVTGVPYVIVSSGTTDFTLIGAANSNVGTVFTATGAGSGTGTARVMHYKATAGLCILNVGKESTLDKSRWHTGIMIGGDAIDTAGGGDAISMGSGQTITWWTDGTPDTKDLSITNSSGKLSCSITGSAATADNLTATAWTGSTPTVASSVGTINSYTSSMRHIQIGKQVHVSVDISVTDNNTGAGVLLCNLPVNNKTTVTQYGVGRNANTGKALVAAITGNQLNIVDYTSAYPVATGETLHISAVYEAA